MAATAPPCDSVSQSRQNQFSVTQPRLSYIETDLAGDWNHDDKKLHRPKHWDYTIVVVVVVVVYSSSTTLQLVGLHDCDKNRIAYIDTR